MNLLACRAPAEIWLSRACVVAAWIGLALAAAAPAHGLGVALCWFQDATGVPCPGCGLTRSLSCALRGMVFESLSYHPLGVIVFGVFLFTAGQSVFPRAQRQRLAGFMQRHALCFNSLYIAFVASFLGFGLVRALLALARFFP